MGSTGSARDARRFAIASLAYLAAQVLAQVVAGWLTTSNGVSVWFPPAAIMLVYLAHVGVRGAPVALVVRLVVSIVVAGSPRPVWQLTLSGAVVVAAYLVSAEMLRRPVVAEHGPGASLRHRTDAVRFVVWGGVVGPVLAAVSSRLVVAGTDGGLDAGTLVTMGQFALGDAAAVLTLVPLAGWLRRPDDRPRGEASTALAGGMVLVAVAAPPVLVSLLAGGPQLFFVLLVPVIVAALAREVSGTALVVAAGAFSTAASFQVIGGSESQVVAAQLFLVVAAVTGHLVARTTSERDELARLAARQAAETAALFEGAATATLLVDGAARIRAANGAAARLLGRPADELPGLHVDEVLPHVAAAELVETSRTLPQPVEIDRTVTLPGRLTALRLVAAHVPAGPSARPDVVLQLIDLTDRRRAEDALRESRDSLNAYAATVAHDLRTPLAAIGGYARLVLEHGDDAPIDVREVLERITRNADRMSEHTDALLEEARRLVRRQQDTTDLTEMVAWLRDLLAVPLAETGGEVRLLADDPHVPAPRTPLQQVLVNLVTNSLKYRSPDRPPVVTIRADGDGDVVRVVVDDNGRGMPPDELERAFDLGTRGAAADGDGLGLGLGLCRRIVQREGGTITAAPLDPGTRIEVAFPRQHPFPLEAGAVKAPGGAR